MALVTQFEIQATPSTYQPFSYQPLIRIFTSWSNIESQNLDL